jgi:hypothetical protein
MSDEFVVNWGAIVEQPKSWETVLPKNARLGGPTINGNSKWADFTRCPYRYYLKHVEGLDSVLLSDPLEIGGALHELLAIYYEDGVGAAFDLLKKIEGVTPAVGAETRRLFEAWLKFYGPKAPRDLRFVTIATELPLKQDKPFPYSARIDHIITKDDQVWIVEHKTSSARFVDLVKSYRMDSQLIGQVYLWNKSKYVKQFGRCVGVVVDLIVKTREIGCFWEQVVIDDKMVEAFERDMGHIAFERELCERSKYWPRKRHNCSKYNRLCSFFDYCLSNGEDETGLSRKKGKGK